MALTATQSKSMYQFFALAFNAAPGVTYMNQLDAAINSGMSVTQVVEAFTSKAEFTSTYPGFLSNEAFATRFINNNVGSFATDAAKTAAIADIAAALNAGWSRGKTITQVFTNISNLPETDATWGNVVKLVNNKVAYAQYYTETMLGGAEATPVLATLRAVIANVTPTTSVVVADMAAVLNPAPVPVAQTFTLTAGTDNIPGGAGDDTITAVLQAAGATGTTVAPGDVVNGGAGTDTLSIAVAGALGADYTLSAIQTSGVEKVLLNNFDTAAFNNTVDTSLMTGLTTVGLSASDAAGDTIFTGLNGLVGAELRNGSGDLTLTYNAAVVAGAADTQAVTVSNLSAGTLTVDGAETIAITSELVKSTLTNVASNSLKTITVAGAADLTISTALTNATINAAAATGAVNVKLGTATHTVTTGSGNDTIDAAGSLTSADTINAGTGTDTLKLSVAGTVAVGTSASKGDLFNVSGVEVIDIASTNDAATLNLDSTTGVTTAVAAANVKTVTITGDNTNTAAEAIAFTLNGVARTTAAVDFTGNAAADVSAANTAIKNAINAISGFTATAGNTGAITVTATTGEAIELAITAGSASTFTEVTSAYSDVSFTNVTTQNIDVYSADAVTASLKDASGTADVLAVNLKTVSADKGFNQAIGTITANNIETINLGVTGMTDGKIKTVAALTGNAVKTLNITGDSDLTITAFTGSSALTTIDGSTASGDLILAAAPAAKDQSIMTGSGNDTINMGALLTAADTIDGGANNIPAGGTSVGKDTLTADVTGVIGTAGLLNIANVETLNLTNTGTATLDLSKVTGASLIAVTGAAGTTTLNKLGAAATVSLGFTDQSGAAVTGTTTLALADATGTADSITVNLAEVTSNTLKTTGIETVNLAFNNTAAISEATTTLTSTGLTASKLVVTGAAADTATVLALGTLNAATTTVDASAYSGVLTMTANDATNATISIKTGNVNNAIVGGAGNDTVTIGTLVGDDANGGAGTDILNATIKASLTEATTNFETINYTVDKNVQVTVTAANGAGVDTATTFNLLGGDALTTYAMDFVSPDALTTINMAGYTGKSTALTFAASQLAASKLQTITGGAGNDTITATTANNDAGVASMTGIENLVLNVVGGASTFDFSKTTGLVKVSVDDDNTARTITLSKIADTTAVAITTGATGTTVVIDSATKTAADNSIKVTTGTTVGTVNLSISNVETLNLINTTGASTVDLSAVAMTTAGATSKMIVTGDQVLTIAATNAAITTIDASGMGVGGTVVQTGRSGSAASVYTGADGADTFIMKNSDDVINAGAGTDTLTIAANLVLGGIQVNLNATGDQITTFNGSANAAVQTNFENVNLTGVSGNFGADVTAKSTGSTITGTTNSDVFTLAAAVDTVVINDSTFDTINTFTKGAAGDVINLSLAALEAAGGSGINAAASNFTKLNSAADGADVAAAASVIQELTLNGAASTVNASNADIFVMIGNTAANTDAVETNLEVGGDVALTINAADDVVGQSFLVVYSDGADAFLASVRVNAVGAADTDFEAGNLTAVNIAKLVGISSIAASDFNVANFTWIA